MAVLLPESVRPSPPASQSAQMLSGFDKHHTMAHTGNLHGGHNTAGGSAVNDNVVLRQAVRFGC